MKAQIFVNLAVNNLEWSSNFYSEMGFTVNPTFSDDSAKCMVWSEEIFLMIMTKEKFSTFSTKPKKKKKNYVAGIYALSVESVDHMHGIVDKALKAGGKEPKPLQDHGFMQLRTVEDADGHTWEVFFMDMSQFPTK